MPAASASSGSSSRHRSSRTRTVTPEEASIPPTARVPVAPSAPALPSKQHLPSAALAQPDHVTFPMAPARDNVTDFLDASSGEVLPFAGCPGTASIPRLLLYCFRTVAGPANTGHPIACLA
ncbi:hypothetical protein AOLI_G00213780 [Acnodon oligacanthus]